MAEVEGVRHVRGHFEADENGLPVLKVNHDDYVRAVWELTMEKYFPKPKPLPRWRRLWNKLRAFWK